MVSHEISRTDFRSGLLEHRIAVCSRRRNRLNYIPVLYNLAIFYPKKIHHRIAEFTGATHPVTVKDDHVSIRERSFDLHVRFGVVAAKPGDKLGDASRPSSING